MPYDLYGKYYSSRKEAIRMERYQMREIDAGIAEQEAQRNEQVANQLHNKLRELHYEIEKERQIKDELTAGILPKTKQL